MRLILAVALALLLVPLAAADVSPGALVLGQVDVPAGFRLDPKESGLRSNELEAKESPEARTKFKRWRRVTGYQVKYLRGSSEIEARVDVFRGADGARNLLEWVDLELRKAGFTGQKRARAGFGAESWVHWVPSPSFRFTLVVWRHGRVFAGVMGRGISRDRTLALARAQQRRMAAGLG